MSVYHRKQDGLLRVNTLIIIVKPRLIDIFLYSFRTVKLYRSQSDCLRLCTTTVIILFKSNTF